MVIRFTVMLLLATWLATPAGGAAVSSSRSPLVADVTLPHATVLPGVPFDFHVTLKNVTERPLAVRDVEAALAVTLPDGSSFLAGDGSSRAIAQLRPANGLCLSRETVQLEPGETSVWTTSWIEGPQNWSRYAEYSGPGSYAVALDLSVAIEAARGSEYIRLPRTESVSLIRDLSVGDDAEIWNRMQEAMDGRWSDNGFSATRAGAKLADTIVDAHPTSAYYPYALLLGSSPRTRERLDLLREAAARFSGSPAAPYLLRQAGVVARYLADRAARRNDLVAAHQLYSVANESFSEALRTNNLAVRASSEHGLREIESSRSRLRTR